MAGRASGSDRNRTSYRIPSALSRTLPPQPSAYAAASPASLAPRGHSAVDLQDAGKYPRCQLWSKSVMAIVNARLDSAAFGGRLRLGLGSINILQILKAS